MSGMDRVQPPYLHLMVIAEVSEGPALAEMAAAGETAFERWDTLAPEGLGYGPRGREFYEYDPSEPGWETRVPLPGEREAYVHSISSRAIRSMRDVRPETYAPRDWYDEEWDSDRRYHDEALALERLRAFAAAALERRKGIIEIGIRRVVPGLQPLAGVSWTVRDPQAARGQMTRRAQRLAGLLVESLQAPEDDEQDNDEHPRIQLAQMFLHMPHADRMEFKKAAAGQALATLLSVAGEDGPDAWVTAAVRQWLADPSEESARRAGKTASDEMWDGGVRQCRYPVDYLRPIFVLAREPGITAATWARKAVLATAPYLRPPDEWQARRRELEEWSDRWQLEAARAIREGRRPPEPEVP